VFTNETDKCQVRRVDVPDASCRNTRSPEVFDLFGAFTAC